MVSLLIFLLHLGINPQFFQLVTISGEDVNEKDGSEIVVGITTNVDIILYKQV